MEEKKTAKRTRIVTLRLTPDEFVKIEKKVGETTFRKLSEYVRAVLFGGKIVGVYRNRSIDDLIAELAMLRQEINRIGVNFNQSVKKLHVLQNEPEFKRWLLVHELEKKTMVNKLDEIKKYIRKIAELWLR
ncbi:plasmid mobilization protein [Pedobacter xixiisoli]|uniref:Mobilisation protein (MobC) n=1 Tax=Pedobacter xixiisoli TaxID=1476464 RepID=A0A286A743_9SPHI|nr:plasmid mobilization relaxosome protein MobC [Pedobacter xixiisoli]SOD17753.1 hypothetical protein SAMN06297358_2670 [Pedobacter xixiisoli]